MVKGIRTPGSSPKGENKESKDLQATSVVKTTSDDAFPVLQGGLPAIGQEIDSMSIEKQFFALLGTSRMQKDYKIAENLTKMINKNRNISHYDYFLAVALLNQAELFAFKDPMKKEVLSEEDSRDTLLRKEIQGHLKKNNHILDDDQIAQLFGKSGASLLADFAIQNKNLTIIYDCLTLIGSLDQASQEYLQLQSQLEESFMRSSMEEADIKMIEEIFLRDIWVFFDDGSMKIEIDYDPHYCWPAIITGLVNAYLCDPLFTLEQYNKQARSQIWKYGIIRETLGHVLTKIGKAVKYDRDDLAKLFEKDEVEKSVKPIFENLLKKSVDQAIVEKEIYDGLMKVIGDHKSFFEEN